MEEGKVEIVRFEFRVNKHRNLWGRKKFCTWTGIARGFFVVFFFIIQRAALLWNKIAGKELQMLAKKNLNTLNICLSDWCHSYCYCSTKTKVQTFKTRLLLMSTYFTRTKVWINERDIQFKQLFAVTFPIWGWGESGGLWKVSLCESASYYDN